MQTEMQLHSSGSGMGQSFLSVPVEKAYVMADAIRSMLALTGNKVRYVDSAGEEIVSAEEVFSHASPAMALRGARGKMEWTQQELAEKLNTTQICISAMESGKRPISVNMAKRLGKLFNISYKVFL